VKSVLELSGILHEYAVGKSSDWETIRAETVRIVAEEIAAELQKSKGEHCGEVVDMQAALKVTAVVQPGGKIEVVSSDLKSGDKVEVIILAPRTERRGRRSAVDILADAPGHRLFKTADEVDAYIRAERDSWNH